MLNQLLLLTDSNQGNEQYHINQLLAEYSSLYGMRVKTLRREEFPTGVVYHSESEIMKGIFDGSVKPYMFHMSWTYSKDDKLLHFQQTGDWFAKPKCIGGEATSLRSKKETVIDACCSAEPLISCHYSDMPSLPSCKNKKMKAQSEGAESFW